MLEVPLLVALEECEDELEVAAEDEVGCVDWLDEVVE